jgi:hypothetical protein
MDGNENLREKKMLKGDVMMVIQLNLMDLELEET